jgi:hypothetical protein
LEVKKIKEKKRKCKEIGREVVSLPWTGDRIKKMLFSAL